jgi:hypothetical protein
MDRQEETTMRRPRVSLAGLMGFILVCGLGIAALRDASETWAGVMLLATLGLLAAAVLGVVYRRGGRRARWLGFALFGWGYLVLTFGPWFVSEVRPKLPTSKLLNDLHARLNPSPEPVLAIVHRVNTNTQPVRIAIGSDLVRADEIKLSRMLVSPPNRTNYLTLRAKLLTVSGNAEDFQSVGHCLLALLVGLVGAMIARWFHASREPVA